MSGNLCHKGGRGDPTANGKCHFEFPFFWNPSLTCTLSIIVFPVLLVVIEFTENPNKVNHSLSDNLESSRGHEIFHDDMIMYANINDQ